jgi:fumarylacetoacetase
MYWTFGQLVAHHTSNGCNLRPGDLIASGTLSGPTPESLGCLLELTSGGKRPLVLPNTEERQALEAGDEITLIAYCERPGYRRIGFGRCVGRMKD